MLVSVFLVLFAYIAGAFSPSVHLGRLLTGIDLRQHGSGNPGTTNAFRVFGRKVGIMVFAADVLKGFVPVLLARMVADPWITVLTALAAIGGHNYSVFLRGRGGKGVATGAGTVMAMTPVILAVQLVVFGFVLVASAYVSLASLTAVALYPVLAVATGQPRAYIVFSFAGAAIVFFAHRGNISRLLRRNERRVQLPGRKSTGVDDVPSERG